MKSVFAFILMVVTTVLPAQVEFTESNLPIILIDTNGQEIRNEPRIQVQMRAIDNGENGLNHVNDSPANYDGIINIELRGSSAQWKDWPKRQYGFETQTETSENRNVELLGLPEENDWILYGPYSDKSLLRNVLVYRLFDEMGYYSPRTRFCEVVLNGDYRGLYVLTEKIKRDKNRVDISDLNPSDTTGDQLTGGYIFKIDRYAGDSGGWISPFRIQNTSRHDVYYVFHHPGADDLLPVQKSYIKNFMTEFEMSMLESDWETDLSERFNIETFIDYLVLNEFSKNIDTWTFSTFFYKDRDSKDARLTIGPVWDYNLAFGNANYFEGELPTGWLVQRKINVSDRIPAWLPVLWENESIQKKFAARWLELRQSIFSESYLFGLIDEWTDLIDAAQKRNFERWPILSEYVWPNNFVGATYAEEIDYLKNWISQRIVWMDDQLKPVATVEKIEHAEITISSNFPNPFSNLTSFTITPQTPQQFNLKIYNTLGQCVIQQNHFIMAAQTIQIDLSGFPNGIYFYQFDSESVKKNGRIIKLE